MTRAARMPRWAALAALLAAGIIVGRSSAPGAGRVIAHQTAAPLRDAATVPAAGSAVVGRVVVPDTGAAVPRATVAIAGPVVAAPPVLADSDGRFVFTGLPPGRYTLTASKLGYVSPSSGATGHAGSIVHVPERGKAYVELPLLHGASIAGRITSDLGEPIAEITVRALRLVRAGSEPRVVEAGRTAETDDRGEYRIGGLPPGRYYVSASGGGSWRSGNRLLPLGELYATGDPSRGSTVFRYGRRYYPGTALFDHAHAVLVETGHEMTGIDFAVPLARVAMVAGSVTDRRGAPAAGTLALAAVSDPLWTYSMATTLRAGGTFLLRLDPGEYLLVAQGTGTSHGVAAATIVVGEEDIEDVPLTLRPGGRIGGRIVYEGASAAPAIWPVVRAVYDVPTTGRSLVLPVLPGSRPSTIARIHPDGTFEILDVIGTRRIHVDAIPEGWTLKAILTRARDLTQESIRFDGGEQLDDVRIVLVRSDLPSGAEGVR